MKVLILTVSAGEGHNSMSRAVSNYLKDAYRDVEIKQVDLFKDGQKTRKKKIANWMVNDGYFTLVKYFIKFANSNFERLKVRNINKKATTLRNNFIKPAFADIEKVVNDFKPDAVFCAHTFAGIIMTDLRNQGNENAKKARVVTVVSDYDVAPYTELLTGVDFVVTPSDDFDDVLKAKGFNLKKRITLGIPVQTKFAKHIDKIEARRELGIDENKKTIMMMSGGVGFGNIAKLVMNLNKCSSDFQIVCVCGRNTKLKQKLEKLKKQGKIKKDIYVFGFVNNVDVIMSAADVLIGKIGGVGIAEAFNKHLPIIANKKLPFQEYDNMLYLKERNACEYISKNSKACQVVDRFFQDENKQSLMRKQIEKIRRPNASKDIGDLLVKGKIEKK